MTVDDQLHAALPNLTRAERQLATHILSHYPIAALGSITHGFLTTMGPRFGVPQMVHSRAAFGYRGVILPAGMNTLTAGIGWFIVNSVSGTFALVVLTLENDRGRPRFGLSSFDFGAG